MPDNTLNVLNWTEDHVKEYLKGEQITDFKFLKCIHDERVDGKSLLALTERDVHDLKLKYSPLRLGDLKHFWIAVRQLQKENLTNLVNLGLIEPSYGAGYVSHTNGNHANHHQPHHHMHHQISCCSDINSYHEMERISPPLSVDGRATCIKPEIFKTMISLGESRQLFTPLCMKNWVCWVLKCAKRKEKKNKMLKPSELHAQLCESRAQAATRRICQVIMKSHRISLACDPYDWHVFCKLLGSILSILIMEFQVVTNIKRVHSLFFTCRRFVSIISVQRLNQLNKSMTQ